MVDNWFLTNISSYPVGFDWRINCSVDDRVCVGVPGMCFDF